MFIFLHVAWKQPKPNKRFVLACMLHDFPEEICVAGGTVLSFLALHVSGRRQFKRGTCDV